MACENRILKIMDEIRVSAQMRVQNNAHF